MKRALHGFSLLELLVAMAILGISLGMLYRADGGALRTASDLVGQQRASVIAQSLLDSRDTVPAAGWNETGAATGVAWTVSSAPLPPAPDLQPGAPPLHEVSILLEWQGSTSVRRMELRTLLPQERPRPGGAAG